jgi:hypothetical protein
MTRMGRAEEFKFPEGKIHYPRPVKVKCGKIPAEMAREKEFRGPILRELLRWVIQDNAGT